MATRPARFPSATALLLVVAAVATTAATAPGSTGPRSLRFDPETEVVLHGAVDAEVTGKADYVPLRDASAQCLDGSQYGMFVCMGTNTTSWVISIQGGGWCYNSTLCLTRAGTRLGSSKTWPSVTIPCSDSTRNVINLYYCDGASFSGYREEPYPVPGSGGKTLMLRGIRNLDASLGQLEADHGLAKATEIMLDGGSAGGLSTFLHLDRVAGRYPNARVYGVPICGFFLDAPEGDPLYTAEMKNVFEMQNATGSLSKACQAAYGPDAWKCIMAPHAAPHIQTPWFALQSRFDHWQLSEELKLPCMLAQPYHPPFPKSTCTPPEVAKIRAYGAAFMEQFTPLMNVPGTKNGGFVDACIIHGSTNSSIDGLNNWAAVDAWLQGGKHWYLMECDGSTSAGPCDKSPICVPFP